MSDSKKNKLSEVSILERYRKLKGEKSKIDLSEKIMEITRAGENLSYQEYGCLGQDICITCDSSDLCDPCDSHDFLCIFGDDTGWCVFTDSIDIIY